MTGTVEGICDLRALASAKIEHQNTTSEEGKEQERAEMKEVRRLRSPFSHQLSTSDVDIITEPFILFTFLSSALGKADIIGAGFSQGKIIQ